VVYFNAIETDQQVQAAASTSRKSVQEMGSSSGRAVLAGEKQL
jgi:hypothetical protein